jgi:ribosomal protein S18 acetylase RimI-like enzyme
MGAVRRITDCNCEITRMRIHPTVQGRGFGRAMLAALETRALQLGYSRAVLVTGPDQHPAVDLYRSQGYDDIGLESFGDLIGLRMSKSLTSPSGPREGRRL